MLTREQIVEGINHLGRLAAAEGVTLELCIYGGAAMMLAYGARDVTRDLDVVVRPSETAGRLSMRVAKELGLPEDWLNDGVRRFVSIQGTYTELAIEELEAAAKSHLRITRPSARYLLAMKCLAFRLPRTGGAGDLRDIEFLVHKMGLDSVDSIEEILSHFYPTEAFTPDQRAILTDIIRRNPKPPLK